MSGRFRAIWILLFALVVGFAAEAQEATPDVETPFLPDDLEVITAENAGRIEPLVNLEGLKGFGVDGDFNLAHDIVAAAGAHDGVILWRLQTGYEVAHIDCLQSDAPALSVQFSPSGQRLAISCGVVIEVWNTFALLEGEALRPELMLENANYSRSLTFQSNGRLIAAEQNDGILIWDMTTGEQVAAFGEGEENICCPNFSPDGERLVYIDGQTTQVVDISTLEGVDRWEFRSETFDTNWTFAAGNRLGDNGIQQYMVDVYNLHEEGGAENIILSGAPNHFPDVLAFSPSGQVIASGGEGYGVVLWNSSDGDRLAHHDTPSVSSLGFSPDGTLLLSTHAGAGGLQYYVRLWGVRSEQGDSE